MAIRLVIFDLDGTLIDSLGDLTDSVNELRRGYGRTRLPESTVATHIGQGVAHLLRNTIPEADRDAHPAFADEYVRIYGRRCLNRTRLFPGTRRALTSLKGIRLAVASNKPGRLSRRILRHCGVLGRFACVVGGDETERRKPHPEPIRNILRRFRVNPRDAMVVGDSRFDMEAGSRAGCRICACTFGLGRKGDLIRWKPDAVIGALPDLKRVVDRLNRVSPRRSSSSSSRRRRRYSVRL